MLGNQVTEAVARRRPEPPFWTAASLAVLIVSVRPKVRYGTGDRGSRPGGLVLREIICLKPSCCEIAGS